MTSYLNMLLMYFFYIFKNIVFYRYLTDSFLWLCLFGCNFWKFQINISLLFNMLQQFLHRMGYHWNQKRHSQEMSGMVTFRCWSFSWVSRHKMIDWFHLESEFSSIGLPIVFMNQSTCTLEESQIPILTKIMAMQEQV